MASGTRILLCSGHIAALPHYSMPMAMWLWAEGGYLMTWVWIQISRLILSTGMWTIKLPDHKAWWTHEEV